MKKAVSLILALLLLCALAPAAFASSDEAKRAADDLYELGLFGGVGNNPDGTPNFDLDRAPTRNEAVTMLVRLLGKEAEAKAGNWATPFTDVPDWAKPYVGYAYANGLTKGTGETTFGGSDTVSATQYLTFVLRALGYDSAVDFQWDKAWELSDRIGLTDGRYNAAAPEFLRGDIAIISANALTTRQKGSKVVLLRKLYNQQTAEKWADAAREKRSEGYHLPEALGPTTLRYEDAYALVGKDPAIIADAVKTVGDVIQYMTASIFTGIEVYSPWYGHGTWCFCAPGEEQLRQNYGCCCAGFTNMGLYLLQGDYEETGVIRWLGGGNHTICYVRAGGKYYAFDLTQYPGDSYANYDAPITELDRLEDYYDRMPSIYPKAQVTNLVALTDTAVCYPWGGGGDAASYLVFPTEAQGHVLQIYQKDPSATVSYADVTVEIPMWNSENLDVPATNTGGDGVLFLNCPNGILMPDTGRIVNMQSVSETYSVVCNGHGITNYTVESSDESVCSVSAGADGSFTVEPHQQGICTLRVSFRGLTARYYYAVGYSGFPPFGEYRAREEAA